MSKTRPEDWQGPLRAAAPYYAGETFVFRDAERYGNGAPKGKRDKLARRMIRAGGFARRSRNDRTFMYARAQRLEDERLATNSHEAKRYHLALRSDRRSERRFPYWLRDWCQMWATIGDEVSKLDRWFKEHK